VNGAPVIRHERGKIALAGTSRRREIQVSAAARVKAHCRRVLMQRQHSLRIALRASGPVSWLPRRWKVFFDGSRSHYVGLR